MRRPEGPGCVKRTPVSGGIAGREPSPPDRKRREYWGLRNLAYRIKKKRKGHFTLFRIDAAAVHEMERNMRISEDVLRYLTLKIDEIEDAPTIIMQSRSAREERGRRDGGRGLSITRGEYKWICS